MKRSVLLGLLLLAGLVVLLPLSRSTRAQAESEQPTREFTWSADPGDIVMSVAYGGTLLMYRPVFTLYGDGRLTAEKHSYSGEVIESAETVLSFDEVRELLDPLMDSGFVDTDQKRLEEQITWDADLHSADGGHMVVVLSLTSYTKDGNTRGPLRHRIAVSSPMLTARTHPEVEEFQAIASLSEQLHQLDVATTATGEVRR